MKRLLWLSFLLLAWLNGPAWACNCIASEGNPKVMNAYLIMTFILIGLPIATSALLVRALRAWEAPDLGENA